jgi:cell division protein FtsQ
MDRPSVSPPAHRLGGWLIAALLVLLVVLCAWIIGFSRVLGVGTVKVSGQHYLTASEIRSAAAIRPGTPLVRLDTATVRARVLRLPDVKGVTVVTHYPSTVTITVVERVAVGHRAMGGGDWLVDADGVAFRQLTSTPKGIPSLTETGNSSLDDNLAAVAGSLSRSVAKKVANITATSAESITLTMTDGRSVLWGGTDREKDKAALLPALLTQPGSYFDISDPDTVISRGGH